LSVLQKLEQRSKKYIELRGEYVEYSSSLVTAVCFLPGRAKDLSAPPRKCNFIQPRKDCDLPCDNLHETRRRPTSLFADLLQFNPQRKK
jgi:hypothetical protein